MFQKHSYCRPVRSFIVYICPIVEYNSVIWSPQNVHDNEAIERVQRKFTTRLPGLHTRMFDRLKQLKILSLELRRLHVDLIMCYKIVFGHVNVNFDDFFSIVLSLQHEAIHLKCLRNTVI